MHRSVAMESCLKQSMCMQAKLQYIQNAFYFRRYELSRFPLIELVLIFVCINIKYILLQCRGHE